MSKSGGVAPMLGGNETEGLRMYTIYRNAIHEMNEDIVLPEWKTLSARLKNAYERMAEDFRLHCEVFSFPLRTHRW